MDAAVNSQNPEPTITVFHCQHCCGTTPLGPFGGDAKVILKPGCVAEVGAREIREAFATGADGILILGCLGGACQVPLDELADLRRIHEGTLELKRMGLAPARLQRLWLTPREAARVPQLVGKFRRQVAGLGSRWQAMAPSPGAGATLEAPVAAYSSARA